MQCANNATFFLVSPTTKFTLCSVREEKTEERVRNKPRKDVSFSSLSPLIVVKCAMINFRLLSEYIECGKETKCVKNHYESSTYRTIGCHSLFSIHAHVWYMV